MSTNKPKDSKTLADTAMKRAGFDAKGEAYPGVDPETGERRAVTIDALRKEYGPKRGEMVYHAVSLAGGFGYVSGSTPDLGIKDLPKEQKAAVEKVLADAHEQPLKDEEE